MSDETFKFTPGAEPTKSPEERAAAAEALLQQQETVRAAARAKVKTFKGAEGTQPPYTLEDLHAPGGPPEPYRRIPQPVVSPKPTPLPSAAPIIDKPVSLPAGVVFFFPPNWSGLTCIRFLNERFSKPSGQLSLHNGRSLFAFE